MTYIPARCDTLLIPTGDAGDHLFVIATDACSAGQHLLVNFTSIKPGRKIDNTCIIKAGEHPFVTHDSYVLYRSAQLQPAQRIGRMVDGWMYKTHQPATPQLTDRILSGFETSPFTPRFIEKHLKDVGFIKASPHQAG